MPTDWTSILNDAVSAAKRVLDSNWPNPDTHVVFQIQQIVSLAKFLQDNGAAMDPDERADAISSQKALLGNVLKGYEGIAIAQATIAVQAVINAIVTDIPALAATLV